MCRTKIEDRKNKMDIIGQGHWQLPGVFAGKEKAAALNCICTFFHTLTSGCKWTQKVRLVSLGGRINKNSMLK
jgi:hypothetical protein